MVDFIDSRNYRTKKGQSFSNRKDMMLYSCYNGVYSFILHHASQLDLFGKENTYNDYICCVSIFTNNINQKELTEQTPLLRAISNLRLIMGGV